MLSPEQQAARTGKLTASRVACLMTGNKRAIMDIWRELIGDPTYEPNDLSGIWAVQLGTVTEPLNLHWYEFRTGRSLSRHGEVINHPTVAWAACTIDAWDDILCCPVEAKHVGGRETRERILDRYKPQFHWQMIVTGSPRVMLSLIEGSKEPWITEIHCDLEYAEELQERAKQFMYCVETMTSPVSL